MKLGTETGSVVNHLMSGTNGQPEPEIGMGATILQWSDRTPCTIVAVRRFKGEQKAGQVSEIDAQEDKATRTDNNGMSECQRYEYERDTQGWVTTFKRNKKGAFVSNGGNRLRIGDRSKYHDYSF
jgi:hypothetical protein